MKIQEILNEAIFRLKENKIEEPINKAKRLLAFTLNVTKEYLLINYQEEIPKEKVKTYNENIEKLISGEPIQYIIGKQEFMGIEFIVNKNVLIPQPDTEILVEKSIEIAKTYEKPKILDLCTGSGAIAVSTGKIFPQAIIYASDISKEALLIAKTNDKSNKIKFIQSDMFENIEEKFDIIVSNPPYIKTEEIKKLSKEVQNEPNIALDGGKDGLQFYKEIIEQAYNYLNKNGYICLEIGEDQKEGVTKLIENNRHYKDIKTYKDLNKNDRVIICYYSD